MKIVVILPTYNEKDNIGLIIHALQEQFRKIPHEMHILVVDDNSPDGTADIVRAACDTFSNLHLITGEKQGLGAAYLRGMTFAINELLADVVMEMDADFSHKPEDVPRLIDAVAGGADFAIGSRYVPGGKIPEDWSFLRRMNSRWGNIFAHREFILLKKLQSSGILPPGTYLLPIAKSAPPATASINRGTSSGLWEKSASISMTTSASSSLIAKVMPRR